MDDARVDFGGYTERVMSVMTDKRLSIEDVAERSGLRTDDVIAQLYKNGCGNIKIRDIWLMAKGLECDVVWLMLG